MTGLSETKAVAIGSWLKRNLAYIVVVVAVIATSVWLVHKGAEWRDNEIRQKWAATFRAINIQSAKLMAERAKMQAIIEDRVKEAIASAPTLATAKKTINCDISIDAVKRLNRIIK